MVAVLVLACLAAALVGAATAALLSAWSTRRRMVAKPHTFRCKVAHDPADGDTPIHGEWPRSVSHASWVHDVLLVCTGWFQTTLQPVGVHFAEGPIDPAAGPDRLGRDPVVLTLHLDDGTRMRLAASRRDTIAAAGPFLAAVAMSHGDHPRRMKR